ncbi:MAG: hypothetical protein IPL70_16025 [Uliginosibacterium sp.]|nr:hypothetical protein [Uliginosibacterium sp.]
MKLRFCAVLQHVGGARACLLSEALAAKPASSMQRCRKSESYLPQRTARRSRCEKAQRPVVLLDHEAGAHRLGTGSGGHPVRGALTDQGMNRSRLLPCRTIAVQATASVRRP